MTAPAAEPNVGSTEISIESIMAEGEGQTSPTTLSGDDVPVELRGKTIADVFSQFQQMQNTLKINAEVMQRLSSQSREPVKVVVDDKRAPAGPVTALLQEMTDEEWDTLYKENPLKAAKLREERLVGLLAAGLEQRLGPLGHSASAIAESDARRRFPIEFEIFGAEIEAAKSLVNPATFANPMAWQEMISMVRGSPGNIDRYIAEVQKRAGVKSIEDQARSSQAGAVGYVPPSREAPSSPAGSTQLDSLQSKVAEEFGMTEAEYIKFSKLGDVIGG